MRVGSCGGEVKKVKKEIIVKSVHEMIVQMLCDTLDPYTIVKRKPISEEEKRELYKMLYKMLEDVEELTFKVDKYIEKLASEFIGEEDED